MNRWLFGLLLALATAAVSIGGMSAGRREGQDRSVREETPVQTAAHIIRQHGVTAIILSPAAQRENGIRVASLRVSVRNQQVQATAVVLPVQPLIDARGKYEAAEAAQQKAQADANVARQEFERLGSLVRNGAASVKELQFAKGAWRADLSKLQEAQGALALAKARILENWGPKISLWIITGAPEFKRLAHMQDVLVQVMLPPGAEASAPESVVLELLDRHSVSASLVSQLPHVSARIQSPSYLYITPARPDLVPGMAAVALLSKASPEEGDVVPEDSVVWWHGKRWVYIRTASDRFVRTEVSTPEPISAGWLVGRGLRAGEEIVVVGAGQLLSEEFRSSIRISS